MASGDAEQTHEGHEGVGPPHVADAPMAAEIRFAAAPPLVALATLTALAHVAVKRVLLPLWLSHDATPPEWLRSLLPLTLNVAALSALVALCWALWQMGREDDYTHASRRLLIVLLGAGVVAIASAALLLRQGRLAAHSILLATAATHALTVQLAMAALRYHTSLAGRTTAGLVAAASLFPLGSMLLRQLMPLGPALITRDGVTVLHGLGELSFLAVPIAGAFVVVPWEESPVAGRARAAGAIATFGMGVLFAAAAQLPAEQYGHLLYSTLRLEFALERASLGYAVPISLAAGAATAALLSKDPRHRQGGWALWLWLAAGYNPLSPARLLLWALASVLLSRALVSLRLERMGTGAREGT